MSSPPQSVRFAAAAHPTAPLPPVGMQGLIYFGLDGRVTDLNGTALIPNGIFQQVVDGNFETNAFLSRNNSASSTASPLSSPLRAMRLGASPARHLQVPSDGSSPGLPPRHRQQSLPVHSSLGLKGPNESSPGRLKIGTSPKRERTDSDSEHLNATPSPAKKPNSAGVVADEQKESPRITRSFRQGAAATEKAVARILFEAEEDEPMADSLDDLNQSLAATPSAASAASSITIEIPSNLLQISGLLSELDSISRPENFTSTLALKLLQTLDTFAWNVRNDATIKEILYTPSFFLRLCDIKSRLASEISSTSTRLDDRVLMRLINTGFAAASSTQKMDLIGVLRREQIASVPAYVFLAELCFTKYYRSIEPSNPMTRLHSDRFVLNNVMHLCQSFNQATPLQARVLEFAQNELKKITANPAHDIDRLFHFTGSHEGIIAILKSGIEVRHEKKFEGAFVSTNLEESFGKFGLTVSSRLLVGKKCHIQRRDDEDNGSIWIGAQETLPVYSDRILVSPAATAEDITNLKAGLAAANIESYELIPTNVYSLYLEYARSRGWAIPIPPMLSPGRLTLKSRGKEQ